MSMNRRQLMLSVAAAATVASLPAPALATGKYDTGASDAEIVIGQSLPYSGPLSMLGSLGKTATAWFEKINSEGGINGRKVRLISLDDGYSPPKTVEATRRLVERDGVLLIFGTVGTASNMAIRRYLNAHKVPQMLIMTGSSHWNDPKGHPWTISAMMSYPSEARMYARHMLESVKEPRIAILSQNDDFGRDYLNGIKAELGDRAAKMIVAQATYEVTDPTVDSQMLSLKASGANVFFSITNGKFTVQALRRAGALGWKPQIYLPVGTTSIASILKPAGFDNAKGAITIANQKNPLDPQWRDDAGIKEYYAFMKQWAPRQNPEDTINVSSYSMARVLTEVLKRCGDDLTRANVMRQMQTLKGFRTPVMLPGVSLSTSATDYDIYDAIRLQRFDGASWVPFG
ncbi:MAG: ABC transporter substrate-binding protein, partial [Burkholderiaceae bacterium]